jgi:hypothetical protein
LRQELGDLDRLSRSRNENDQRIPAERLLVVQKLRRLDDVRVNSQGHQLVLQDNSRACVFGCSTVFRRSTV